MCDGAVGLRCEIALNFLRNRRVKYIYEYYKWVNTGGFNVTVRKQQVMLNSSRVRLSFLEELSGLFRQGRVDVDTGSHFKSRRDGQSRDNLKMPMVIVFLFIPDGRSMDDVIIVRIVQLGVKFK